MSQDKITVNITEEPTFFNLNLEEHTQKIDVTVSKDFSNHFNQGDISITESQISDLWCS